MKWKRIHKVAVFLLLWSLSLWFIYTKVEDTKKIFIQTDNSKTETSKKRILREEDFNQYFSTKNLQNVSIVKFEEDEANINNINNIFLMNDSLLTITNYEIESASKDKLKAKNFIDDVDLLYEKNARKININYIWYDKEIETVLFCIGVNTRLGNIMHEYFLAQGIAFFMQKKFQMVDPLNYKKYNCSTTNLKRNLQYFYKYKNYRDNEHLWQQMNELDEMKKIEAIKSIKIDDMLYSHFLPKDTDYRTNKETSNRIKLFILNIIYYINQQSNIYDRRKPYRSVLRLIYYNPIFYYDVVGKLIVDSLDTYYLDHEMEKDKPFFTENEEEKEFIFNKNIDYSIHFRCGDIVVGKYPYHGLLTLNYFKKIFNKFEMNKNIRVYFFTQLSSNTIRGSNNEQEFQNSATFKCNYIVEHYAKYIRKIIYPSKLIIIGAGNINDDLYKMIHSKVLICSASTFCEIAAFANNDGSVILPSNGPWKDWFFGFNVWYPMNHKFVNLNKENTLILTGLQMYGWNASKIVDYLIKH